MVFNYTFIIPHKNIPHLLRKCLDSIPHWDDVQIIVVDDNSDSFVVDFLHFPGVKEKNTEVYFTKKDKGPGYARNIGLKYAKGKWILFADADDFYTTSLPAFLKKYKDSQDDCIFFLTNSVDVDTLEERHRTDALNEAIIQGAHGNLDELIYLTYSVCCKMIKHQFLIDKKLRFDEVMVSEDVMFSIYVATKMRHYYIDIDAILYTATVRSNSLTHLDTAEMLYSRSIMNAKRNHYLEKCNKSEYCINYDIYYNKLAVENKWLFFKAAIIYSYYSADIRMLFDAIRVCIGALKYLK